MLYSEKMACVNCGINISTLEPRSFSFNSPFGACKRCNGVGSVMEIDAGMIITDPTVPAAKVNFLGGADRLGAAFLKSALLALVESYVGGNKLEPLRGNSRESKVKRTKKKKAGAHAATAKEKDLMETPFAELPSEIRDAFIHGSRGRITFRQGDY